MSEVERALLSCIAQDPAVIGSEVLSVFQCHNPFDDDVVRRIYHAWSVSNDRTIFNAPAIIERLASGSVTLDWMMEVRSVINAEPSTANWRQHLAGVREGYTRRVATGLLQRALHDVGDSTDIQDLLQAVSKDLLNIDVQKETNELDPRAAVDEEIERMSRGGLSVGISGVDTLLGPLEPGEILIVAARTSVGKSLLVGNIIRWLSVQSGVPGLVHTFEMPAAKCIGRMVASLTHINSREVLGLYQSGDPAVKEAYEKVFNAPIIWDERGSLSMPQIINKLRRAVTNHGIKYAVLDHFGFVKLPNGRRNEELGKAIKDFKGACKELGVVPIIVVQLNRGATEGEEPGLHHLKDSGAFEEDASQVILLHRDTVLRPEERQRVAEGKPMPIKVGVAKTRYGETGYRQLALFLHSSLIQDNYVEDEEVPK